jgi:hypothetical protein
MQFADQFMLGHYLEYNELLTNIPFLTFWNKLRK